MKIINVANEFSKTPFGRVEKDGPFNGEKFRRDRLIPAFKLHTGEPVVVDFNGISLVIGSSFLEEAFGGLVRLENFEKNEILDRLVVRAKTPIYELQIRKFVKAAQPQSKGI